MELDNESGEDLIIKGRRVSEWMQDDRISASTKARLSRDADRLLDPRLLDMLRTSILGDAETYLQRDIDLAALKASGAPFCKPYIKGCAEMEAGLLAEAGRDGAFKDVDPLEYYENRLENCRCYQRRRMLACMPRRFQRMTFDSFVCGGPAANGRNGLMRALQTCSDYAANPYGQGWLTLFGNPGVGKTHLAVGVLQAAPMVGRYIGWTEALQHMRDLMKTSDYGMFWQELLDSPLLLVDDIGAQYGTEWADEQLFRLVDYRYSRELPTIWTTNWLVDELGGRVGSRLRDWQAGQVVRVDAPDYRIYGDKST